MRTWVIVSFLVAGALATPNRSAAQEAGDSAAVSAVVEEYVRGWREGDVEALADVFEPAEGVLLWTSGGAGAARLNGMTFQEILDRGSRPNPSYGLETTIEHIDVVDGQLAVARVFISRSGGSYTDYLVLYKLDAGWRIVTKTFVSR